MMQCRCQRNITVPDAKHLFCPFCGMRHLLPCDNPECQISHTPGSITLLESPLCPECGALYRYHSSQTGAGNAKETITPYRQQPTLQQEKEQEESLLLSDLLPASGNPNSLQALRAGYRPQPPNHDETHIPLLGGTPIRLAQTRNGLLYLITTQGYICPLYAESLEPYLKWQDKQLFAHGESFAPEDQAEIITHESLLLLRKNATLYGFHAGTGERLFEKSFRDIKPSGMIALKDCLLLLGTDKENREILQTFALSELCLGGNTLVAEEITTLAASNEPQIEDLPPRCLTTTQDAFVVMNRQGSLFLYDLDVRIPRLLFDSQGGTQTIREWFVHNEKLHVILVKQRQSPFGNKSEGTIECLYTRPLHTKQGYRDTMPIVLDWSLGIHPTPPIQYESHLFLINQNLEILRVSAEDPNVILETGYRLIGFDPYSFIKWELVPNAGYPYLIAHIREKERHRCCRIPLYRLEDSHILNYGPAAANKVQMLFSDSYLFFIDIEKELSGSLSRYTLPST